MNLSFFNSPNASDSLGLVADWTYALNENGEFTDILARLARLVRADAILLVRTSKVDKRARYISRFDTQHGKIWPTEPRTCADLIVGEFMESAKAGSIWKLSDCTSSELSKNAAAAVGVPGNLVEAIVCPLESVSGHVDHIELHFKHQPAEHDVNLLTMMIGTLAQGWGRREPALISKRLSRSRNIAVKPAEIGLQTSILDVENPAQLSRSEFRICSLLKEGMTVNVISRNLSVRPATVRSHLSSIFSKTGVSGQVELLHQLNRAPAGGGDTSDQDLNIARI